MGVPDKGVHFVTCQEGAAWSQLKHTALKDNRNWTETGQKRNQQVGPKHTRLEKLAHQLRRPTVSAYCHSQFLHQRLTGRPFRPEKTRMH